MALNAGTAMGKMGFNPPPPECTNYRGESCIKPQENVIRDYMEKNGIPVGGDAIEKMVFDKMISSASDEREKKLVDGSYLVKSEGLFDGDKTVIVLSAKFPEAMDVLKSSQIPPKYEALETIKKLAKSFFPEGTGLSIYERNIKLNNDVLEVKNISFSIPVEKTTEFLESLQPKQEAQKSPKTSSLNLDGVSKVGKIHFVVEETAKDLANNQIS